MLFQDASLSIYIHVPFCQTRCTYCAFNVYTDLDHLAPAYIDAVCRELEILAQNSPHPLIHSVYFGGGTPSRLSPSHYEKILSCIRNAFPLSPNAEISFESNPNDLSRAYLCQLRELGINRLSIGMQSASSKILQLFDRRHDPDDVENAVRAARQAGFDNINIDVIYGSPYELMSDWQATLEAVLGFGPEHISMYGLELKGGTPLRQQVDSGIHPPPDDDLFAEMYDYATERLGRAGYSQYEISNWSRPGKECQHNLQYWRNLPYVGIGAGSHGFAGGYRYSNIAAPGKYLAALAEVGDQSYEFPLTPAVAKSKYVDRQDDLYDTIMMGIRLTDEGINRDAFESRFGRDIVDLFQDSVFKLQDLKLLEVKSDRVRLTPAGRLLSNAVIRELV